MMKYFNNNQILIGIEFLKKLGGQLYLREIERLTKLDIRTIHVELGDLVGRNILDFEIRGKMKFFFFKNSFETDFYIQTVEIAKAFYFISRHNNLKLSFQVLSQNCKFIIFGSYANGTQTKNSDLDMVCFSKKTNEIDNILKALPIKVHIHYINIEEFSNLLHSKNFLAVEILNNHVCFGLSSFISKEILKWIK